MFEWRVGCGVQLYIASVATELEADEVRAGGGGTQRVF